MGSINKDHKYWSQKISILSNGDRGVLSDNEEQDISQTQLRRQPSASQANRYGKLGMCQQLRSGSL